MKRWFIRAACAAAALLVGAVFSAVVRPGEPAFPLSSAYVVDNGVRETGAVNLVTSIYLGYRAFDTLGEIIVLFIAVSGTVYFLGKRT